MPSVVYAEYSFLITVLSGVVLYIVMLSVMFLTAECPNAKCCLC
jgi:hypothetical protein